MRPGRRNIADAVEEDTAAGPDHAGRRLDHLEQIFNVGEILEDGIDDDRVETCPSAKPSSSWAARCSRLTCGKRCSGPVSCFLKEFKTASEKSMAV